MHRLAGRRLPRPLRVRDHRLRASTPKPISRKARKRLEDKSPANQRYNFCKGMRRDGYLGGVVGEENLLAVAEGGDGGEGALAFPAPLSQQERQRRHRRVRRRHRRLRGCGGSGGVHFLGLSTWKFSWGEPWRSPASGTAACTYFGDVQQLETETGRDIRGC